RKHRTQSPDGSYISAQPATDVGDDVMHVRVRLDGHELIDAHAARLADPAKVVALEVDQHDVFRALFRMRRELSHLGKILARTAASGPRACDGPGVDMAVRYSDQALRGGAEDRGAAPLRQSREGR